MELWTKWPDLLNRIQKDYLCPDIQDLNHTEGWAAATILSECTFETLRCFLSFLTFVVPPSPVSSVPLFQNRLEDWKYHELTRQKRRCSSRRALFILEYESRQVESKPKHLYSNSPGLSPHSCLIGNIAFEGPATSWVEWTKNFSSQGG